MKRVLNHKGFTLVEMLACTVTLLLIGMMCTVGLNLAMKSYHESVFESDCQMLESTMNMYIGDILRHATEVKIDEENADNIVISLSNSAYQISDGMFYISTDGDVDTPDVKGYLYCTVGDNTAGALVIGVANYAKNLYLTSFELHYDDATDLFTGKYTIGSSISDALSRECTFVYRTIAEE